MINMNDFTFAIIETNNFLKILNIFTVYFTVYRPEDPHVERVRRFPDSPPVTRVDSSSYS